MTTSTINQNVVPTIPSAYYGTTAGTGSAYTVSPTATSKLFSITFAVTNAASPTLSVNAGAAINLLDSNGVPLIAGALLAGETRQIADNGSSFLVLSAQSPAINQLQSVSASIAAGALTVGLNPTFLQFRSPTLATGVSVPRYVSAALSLVVPSTATLGTVSALMSRLILLAIDATSLGGAVELAVVNISGGNNLDETTLISTTAISAAATSASVIYSTTARTNVPFRVVGYVESTQATAGTWASPPGTVQPFGGQALNAMSSLGYGQKWIDVTASRATGTTYYNTTGRPIVVSYNISISSGGNVVITVNGVSAANTSNAQAANQGTGISALIPAGASYVVTGGVIYLCFELR